MQIEAAGPGEVTPKELPMSGVGVIDVGTFLAGPYAASIMGEFGAEVLKVEYPIAGNPMRRFGTATKRHDAAPAWLSEGRNNKSVTIDLRQPKGVELFTRLGEHKTRLENRSDANEIVRERCLSLPREQVLQKCFDSRAPAGPLNNIADIFGDRRFHARRNMVATEDEETGDTIMVPNVVPRLSGTPGPIKHLGSRLGEHTEEILKDMLGIGEAEIGELRNQHVI